MYSPHDEGALAQGWFIDRTVYTSQDNYQQELEKIFHKTWHFACLAHELAKPGDYFALDVVGQPILVVRDKDNELRAFFNACTHRGAVLNNKKCGNEKRFTCMYHAWTFNLKGELIGVPYDEAYGPEFDKKKYGLTPVRVEQFHDLIFVTINPDASSLIDYLGEAAPRMAKYVDGIEVIGRNSWTIDGNWKLWHENFRDNYHPQFVHRGFNDMIPHYADKGGNWALAPGHSVAQWIVDEVNEAQFHRSMARMSKIEFPAGERLAIEGRPQEVIAIFPNLDIQPEPQVDLADGRVGSQRGFIQTVVPVAPDRARIDIVIYSSKDDTPEKRQEVLENFAVGQGSWGKVSCDDTEAAVRCQSGLRGVGTRYSPVSRGLKPGKGGFVEEGFDGRDEYSLREFYRVYAEYLGTENSV